MGDTKDDVKYAPNPYSSNHQEGYGSLHGQKLAVRNAAYSGNRYVDEEDEEDYEEDLGEEEEDDDNGEGQNNGVHQHVVKVVGSDVDDDDDSDDDEDDEDDRDDKQKGYEGRVDDDVDVDLARHPKKRKLKSLISSYEFAPRVPPPPPPQPPPASTPAAPKPSSGGRNSLTDWTERETYALLDAWGDRFLQRGRKSLRFEEWQEVVEKVSEVSKIERTDTQCRNRLDTLKKKYKKEKTKIAETGIASKWVYFKKMDVLMSSPPQQGLGLSCGLDSGGYVFVSPRAYLNRANGLDQMRDSPDDSESTEGDNDSDGLPPKKRKSGRDNEEGSSVRMLADCIHKFSEIYEKIESSKRKQMVELEKMRMDFQRDLEMQKREIMERAQAEIAKIRQGEEEEEEEENGSG